MREEILRELELDYEQQRLRNEQEETRRKEQIRQEYPGIRSLCEAREELVLGNLRGILAGNTAAADLPEKMAELNADIRTALRDAGLPEDYLAPVYKCPVCRDTGYTGEPVREMCACMKQAYAEKVRGRIGLDGAKAETFENYDENVIPDGTIAGSRLTQRALTGMARKTCHAWADRWPETVSRDMLLTGKSGLGKTFLMRCMANRLIERGYNVLLVSAGRFFQAARNHYFGNDEDELNEMLEADVLMIDDLGTEPMMQNITVEQLFRVINERQNANRSTVFSSNLDLGELKMRYTERIMSRMSDPRSCTVVTLAGQDIRLRGGA